MKFLGFVGAFFIGALPGVVFAVVIWVKNKWARDDLANARALLKLNEVKNDIKNSANQTLTPDESDDMHGRLGGMEIKEPAESE